MRHEHNIYILYAYLEITRLAYNT